MPGGDDGILSIFRSRITTRTTFLSKFADLICHWISRCVEAYRIVSLLEIANNGGVGGQFLALFSPGGLVIMPNQNLGFLQIKNNPQ